MAFMAAAMPMVSAAMSAVGFVMQSMQQSNAAKQQAQQQEYDAAVQRNNAILANANASNALKVASVQEDQKRRENAQHIGGQKAALIESGIDITSGSGADLVEQSAINNELDALNIRYEGQLKANSYSNQANSYTAQAGLDDMGAKQSRANAKSATGLGMIIGAGAAGLSSYTASGGRYGSGSRSSGGVLPGSPSWRIA